MKLSQCDIILKAMLENKERTWWNATNFQSGKYFVGYEATARMSDLYRMYPDLLVASKCGRYRVLRINWENKERVKEELNRLMEYENE